MNREQIAEALRQNQVVAYPLKLCLVWAVIRKVKVRVKKLLYLKQRPVEKGLILVAPSLDFSVLLSILSRLTMNSFLICKVNMNVQRLGLCQLNPPPRIFS